MKAVRREGQLPSAEQKANQNVTGSMDPSLGISVSLQTETSWLNEHNFHKRGNSVCSDAQTLQSASPTGEELPDLIYQEEDLYSSLSEDLSDLSVLCDMEFSFEYKTCFEKHLNMLPNVGPPTILAYKRESSENDRILAMMKILKERSGKELCKFCRNSLKPFPVESTLYQDFSEEVFCCRQFRDMIQYLLKQQNCVLQNKEIELISVSPHGPYGSEIERQKAKEKIALRLRERHMAKVFESVVTEPTTFLEFGKPMKTISYQLSNAPPVGDNWTIVPEEADAMTSTDSAENELSLCDFTSEMMPERFVEKYYRTGSKFLTMFPDGTAQIFYPSGNLAIIVVPSNKKEAICIVQEDKDHNADILAIFGSSGKATCYHPNGMVWMNINPVGGQYLDSAGRRVRRWHWKSSDSKQPCVQFKPIFISLNLQVGVRIIAQDKIYVSFLAMGKQAKFSVGRKELKKSQVEDIEMDKQSITTSLSTAEDELILFAIKIKFLSLLNKCYECLHSPSKKQWDRLKPPSFLVAQAQKLIRLCSVCDISTDVSASVQDTLRNYVTCDLLT